MRVRWFGVCALLYLLALTAAGGAGEKGEERGSTYYPLRVGDKWTYKAGKGEFTVEVTKLEKVGDVLCRRLEASSGGKVLTTEHLAAKEDGVYRYAGDDQKLEPPVLVLKLPPKKGDSWKVDSKFKGFTIRGTFTEGEEAVEVPAGKFRAVTVSTQGMKIDKTDLTMTVWFAPQVGMVPQVRNWDGKSVTTELEKFEPGKKSGAEK